MATVPPTPIIEGPTLEEVVAALKPELEKRQQAFEDKMLRTFQTLETEVKEFKAEVKNNANKFENATKTFESVKDKVKELVEKINNCIDEIRTVGGKNIQKVGAPEGTPSKKQSEGFGFFRRDV